MKFLTKRESLFYAMTFTVINSINFVNAQNITVKQDMNFEQLLNEKRKLNTSITSNNRFKIQISNGTNEIAKKEIINFKKTYKNYDATMVFNTPNYKVLVGNFRTRIEAERNLAILKKKYSNAIIVKPKV